MATERIAPVIQEIYIDASPEAVFEFFVDAEKLTRWLAVEATTDPRAGGICVQVHADGDQLGPCTMRGEFLVVERPTRVVFTWGFVEARIGIPVGSSTVEVTLRSENNGTHVRLVHRDLSAAETENHSKGWAEMLQRLAHAVSSGVEGN